MHRIPIEGSIDLHAFQPRDIKNVVEDYIDAAYEAGLREVRLIHGRGKGVQRGIVQQALEEAGESCRSIQILGNYMRWRE